MLSRRFPVKAKCKSCQALPDRYALFLSTFFFRSFDGLWQKYAENPEKSKDGIAPVIKCVKIVFNGPDGPHGRSNAEKSILSIRSTWSILCRFFDKNEISSGKSLWTSVTNRWRGEKKVFFLPPASLEMLTAVYGENGAGDGVALQQKDDWAC